MACDINTKNEHEKILPLPFQPVAVSAESSEHEHLAALGTAISELTAGFIGPLDGMFSSLDMLERDIGKRPRTSETSLLTSVRDLKSEVHRMWSLLDSLRTFAAPSPYTFRVMPIAPVVDAVLTSQSVSAAGQHSIQIEQQLPSSLPSIRGDEDKLGQALRCVCQNGLEAMPEGGVLSLSAFCTEEAVSLAVSDSGLGLPLDSELDIFAPLTTTKPGRLGLGLPMARQIAVDHGGTLTYTSRLDHGTTFIFTLPVVSA